MLNGLRKRVLSFFTNEDHEMTLTITLFCFFYYIMIQASNFPNELRSYFFYFLVAIGFIYTKILRQFWYWAFFLGFTVYSIIFLLWYYQAANHYFVMAYWSGALTLTFLAPQKDRNSCLKLNARLLICAVIGISVVQKFLSPTFLDGSFFHSFFFMEDFVRRGLLAHFFGGIIEQTPNYIDLVKTYNETMTSWRHSGIGEIKSTVLPVLTASHSISVFLAWSVVLIETTVTCLYLINRYPRAQAFTLLALFVPIIFLVSEFFFVILICILGLTVLEKPFHKARMAFFAVIIFCFILKFSRVVGY